MAARKASGPACDCGQVVFDLTGAQPGDVLRCPWCRKRYRLEEDGSVKPESGTSKDSSSRIVAPSRPSSRLRMRPPSSAEAPRERRDDVVSDQDHVEVFRFDADDGKEERKSERREVPPSRRRVARPEDIATDPTVPLERISRRRPHSEERVAGGKDELFDDLPPIQPLDLEKWVVRMFLGMIPVGTLLFMAYVIYGVYEGRRDFVTYHILGLTIRGDNPWVWFAGIMLGALVFLGLWVGYVYFFVHRKRKAEAEEKRRKEKDVSDSSRRTSRRGSRADFE